MALSDHSLVSDFFVDQVVFITGGTGFLGKLIVEKLLRVCSGVRQVCLLVGDKKHKEAQERFNEMFESPIFNLLRQEQPDFLTKVRHITGDCDLEDLGICERDKFYLMANVTCIINTASVARPDGPIKPAIRTNVRAVRHLLVWARCMPNLQAMVHVSSAFAHCHKPTTWEYFSEVPIPGNSLIPVEACWPEEGIIGTDRIILRGWPNTNMFTKAAGEEIIEEMGKDLPITIIRPSILMPAAEGPLPGYVDNWYGPIGVAWGVVAGALRVLPLRQDKVADLVPADYVANLVLTAAWHVSLPSPALLYEMHEPEPEEKKVKIYNYVSRPVNPITWGRVNCILKRAGFEYYSVLSLWYYCLFYVPNWYFYKIFSFLLHTVPGCIIDVVLLLIFREPKALNFYRQAHEYLEETSFFTMHDFNITSENVTGLWNKMTQKDQQLFNFNLMNLDWEQYLKVAMKGGRVYLLKDPMDTVELGQSKMKVLAVLHYLTVGAFTILMIQFVEWVLIQIFAVWAK